MKIDLASVNIKAKNQFQYYENSGVTYSLTNRETC